MCALSRKTIEGNEAVTARYQKRTIPRNFWMPEKRSPGSARITAMIPKRAMPITDALPREET